MAAVASDPDSSGWYWLSFAASDTGFRGVAIVGPVVGYGDAIAQAWARKCNPGGEIRGHELTFDDVARIPESFRHRVLTRAECHRVDAMMSGPVA